MLIPALVGDVIRFSVATIIAVTAAGAVAQPSSEAPIMKPGAIGALRSDWVQADLLASGLPVVRTESNIEGDPVFLYSVRIDAANSATMWFLPDGTPFRISTDSRGLQTPEGARVGDTLATLQRIYPKGKVFISAEEGMHFGFLPQGDYVAGRAYSAFVFDPSVISFDCVYDRSKCPDLSERRSVSFDTSW